jgi:endonuclease/exonuclease/phosphatase family metal-dependent hydrolase
MPWICLDYIYVSSDVTVIDASVVSSPLARVASDHFPLLTEVKPP